MNVDKGFKWSEHVKPIALAPHIPGMMFPEGILINFDYFSLTQSRITIHAVSIWPLACFDVCLMKEQPIWRQRAGERSIQRTGIRRTFCKGWRSRHPLEMNQTFVTACLGSIRKPCSVCSPPFSGKKRAKWVGNLVLTYEIHVKKLYREILSRYVMRPLYQSRDFFTIRFTVAPRCKKMTTTMRAHWIHSGGRCPYNFSYVHKDEFILCKT